MEQRKNIGGPCRLLPVVGRVCCWCGGGRLLGAAGGRGGSSRSLRRRAERDGGPLRGSQRAPAGCWPPKKKIALSLWSLLTKKCKLNQE